MGAGALKAPFVKDKWPYWAQPLFPLLTDMAHKALLRYLNRPALRQMHEIDAKLYTVLSLRSFNRGAAAIALRPGAGGDRDLQWRSAGLEALAPLLRREVQAGGLFEALREVDGLGLEGLRQLGGSRWALKEPFESRFLKAWCPTSARCLRLSGKRCGPAC